MTGRWSRDRGETFIELLVAVLIMGIGVVAIVGALLASVRFSDVHRKQATGGADARSYAEAVERFVAADNYVECAGPSAYAPATVGYTAPTGYTAAITGVAYWNVGTQTFAGSCSSSGLQQVTVQVASTDGRAGEKAVVVVRRPCGQGSTC